MLPSSGTCGGNLDKKWESVSGTGWITIPGFGRINPRQDNVNGGRQYFTAYLENDDLARVKGELIEGGPETWHFEFDQPFFLATLDGEVCLETQISLLPGGKYSVKYRQGDWGPSETGGW